VQRLVIHTIVAPATKMFTPDGTRSIRLLVRIHQHS
jgi:hypothetical protein